MDKILGYDCDDLRTHSIVKDWEQIVDPDTGFLGIRFIFCKSNCRILSIKICNIHSEFVPMLPIMLHGN